MLGQVPVGAWVPYPGSHIRLASQRSPFFEGKRKPQIEERYPSDTGINPATRGVGHTEGFEPQVYPLGDFLGPDLVFWTEDPKAKIPGTPLDAPAGPGLVTVIVIRKCCFSTRVDVAPAGSSFLAELHRYSREAPHDTAEVVYNQDVKPGTITVTAEQSLDRQEYKELREHVRAEPRIGVAVQLPPDLRQLPPPVQALSPRERAEIRAEGEYIERVHYPPLPKYAGLNVFGPLRQVAFHGVHGSLMVADKPVSLAGSANLELGNVSGFRDKGGHELISAPLATSAESADLEFSAVGTATVNGVSKTTVNSHLEPILAIVGVVLTLAAGAVGLVSGLRRMRRSKESVTSGDRGHET
jgi:hypothetical protein